MVGTKLEEFSAEVLGVMRDVSPGRDMILCRLSGCNLEHAGIIQGMSGSPIYIDGKLLGAVAFAWEFAKDPIAGVTPFSQMVQYVRSNDRRIAAERKDRATTAACRRGPTMLLDEGLATRRARRRASDVAGAGVRRRMAGMPPIATPLAASGFSPGPWVLAERLGPLGMAPMAGGGGAEGGHPRGGRQAPGAGLAGEHGA